jgi:hypothetical protein
MQARRAAAGKGLTMAFAPYAFCHPLSLTARATAPSTTVRTGRLF